MIHSITSSFKPGLGPGKLKVHANDGVDVNSQGRESSGDIHRSTVYMPLKNHIFQRYVRKFSKQGKLLEADVGLISRRA